MNGIKRTLVNQLEYAAGYRILMLAKECHAIRCSELAHGTRLFIQLSRTAGVNACVQMLRRRTEDIWAKK